MGRKLSTLFFFLGGGYTPIGWNLGPVSTRPSFLTFITAAYHFRGSHQRWLVKIDGVFHLCASDSRTGMS